MQTKIKVNQIQDFEKEVEKIVDAKIEEKLYIILEEFFNDKEIDWERLKEKIDKDNFIIKQRIKKL